MTKRKNSSEDSRKFTTGMNKKFMALMSAVMIFLSACAVESDINVEEIPEILFVSVTSVPDYERVASGNSIAFYDSEGNYYYSDDDEVCSLTMTQLCEQFGKGALDDKITLSGACDREGLQKNYGMIPSLVRAHADIVYPNELPAVESESKSFYGLYYGGDGEVGYILLHRYERMTHIYSDDKRADEIYEWYCSSLKKDK